MYVYEYSDILIHTDVAVYMALYKQANELMWKTPFNMSIGVLASKAKVSIATAKRSRDRLEKAGLIKWESRGGQQSANYWIIEPQHEPQSEPQDEPRHEPRDEPIHKTTKHINNISPYIESRGKNSKNQPSKKYKIILMKKI